ncbi:hypothetical protein ACF1BB_30540 [Streptomyces griseoluteus]|uniref:hypothetical protein n=1 Tax=Streptomyces TaxID=1883 RepID=UPI003702C5EF
MYSSFVQAHMTCTHMMVERAGRYKMLRSEGQLTGPEARREVQLGMGEYVRQVGTECMHAWFEIRLAGTDEIQPVAAAVVEAVQELMGVEDPANDAAIDAGLDAVNAAVEEFIEACRGELWYAPRWWQVHRRLARATGRLWRRLRRSR